MLNIETVYMHDAEQTHHRYFSKYLLDREQKPLFEIIKPNNHTRIIPFRQPETFRAFCDGNLRGQNNFPGDEDRIIAWKLSFLTSQNLSFLWAQAPYVKSLAIERAHTMAAATTKNELIGCLRDDKARGGCTRFFFDHERTRLDSPDPLPWHLQDGFLKTKIYCNILCSSQVSEQGQPQLKTTVFLLNSGNEKNHLQQSILIGASVDALDKYLKGSYEGALDFYLEKAIGSFSRLRESREMRIEGIPQAAVRRFFFEIPPPNGHGPIAAEQMLSPFQRRAVWQKEGEKLGFGLREATALLATFERNRVRFDFKSTTAKQLANGKALFRRAADAIAKLSAIARKKPSNTHTNKNQKSKGQSH